MNKNDLTSYIFLINSELFSFSYSLVPEQLQAQQIVLDAIYASIISDKNLEEKIENCVGPKSEEVFWECLKKSLYQHIYRIAKRRFIQLANSLEINENFSSFYKLKFDEKAVLYLKHVLNFDFDDIEEILQITNSEVLIHLNCARNHLMKNLEMEFDLKHAM